MVRGEWRSGSWRKMRISILRISSLTYADRLRDLPEERWSQKDRDGYVVINWAELIPLKDLQLLGYLELLENKTSPSRIRNRVLREMNYQNRIQTWQSMAKGEEILQSEARQVHKFGQSGRSGPRTTPGWSYS